MGVGSAPLIDLDLSFNPIGKNGAKILAAALPK